MAAVTEFVSIEMKKSSSRKVLISNMKASGMIFNLGTVRYRVDLYSSVQ